MSGVFDLLGTPEERQEQVLRKALELRREQWPHEGYAYRSAGDLLLQHGQFYSGRRLPDEYAHLRGVPGNCFQNALLAVERSSRSLRYVEGVYAIGQSHYTPHAWCLDPNGELLEVSLPTDSLGETRVEGGMALLGLRFWGYYGCVFHPDFVRAVWATQEGHVGMLDRPTSPTLSCHLRLQYDPERRTL